MKTLTICNHPPKATERSGTACASQVPWPGATASRSLHPCSGTLSAARCRPEITRRPLPPGSHDQADDLLRRLASASTTARIRCVPSKAPFSKSSPATAIVLVTCATQTTSRHMAIAYAYRPAQAVGVGGLDRAALAPGAMDPWFLVWGLLLATATWGYRRGTRPGDDAGR
jgi:hypothetical protein